MSLKPLFVSLFAIPLIAACSSSVDGTGGGGNGSSSGGGSGSAGDGSGNVTNGGGTSSGTSAGGSEYDALFDAPASSTTSEDSLPGVWAGSTSYADVRLKIEPTKLTIALRCGSQPAVGVEVGAQMKADSIRLLASKTLGQAYDTCGVVVRPIAIPRCGDGKNIDCFTLDGMTLRFVGVWLFTNYGYGPNDEFTKLSD